MNDDAKQALRNAYMAISGQFFSMPCSSPIETPHPYYRRMAAWKDCSRHREQAWKLEVAA
jgi:hypothetical protein